MCLYILHFLFLTPVGLEAHLYASFFSPIFFLLHLCHCFQDESVTAFRFSLNLSLKSDNEDL